MNQYLEIPFGLPGLNKVNSANRSNPYAGAQLKRRTDADIVQAIRAARLVPVKYPCIVHMVLKNPTAAATPTMWKAPRSSSLTLLYQAVSCKAIRRAM